MAFTRQFVREQLKAYKAGEDVDIDDVVDELLAEHGSTVSKVKKRYAEYEGIDIDDTKSTKAELNAIKNQLNGKSIESVLTELEQLRTESAARNREAAIDELVKDYKFTSKSAERDIRRQIGEHDLAEDGKSFVDAAKFMKELVKNNQDAFVTETKPDDKSDNKAQFMANMSSGSVNTNSLSEQDAMLAELYGDAASKF